MENELNSFFATVKYRFNFRPIIKLHLKQIIILNITKIPINIQTKILGTKSKAMNQAGIKFFTPT